MPTTPSIAAERAPREPACPSCTTTIVVCQRSSTARQGGTAWQEKTWDWATTEIAKRIKATRDANWVTEDDQGFLVNRTEAIASVGGAALDNEECYMLVKALRAMGLVYVEHQARI